MHFNIWPTFSKRKGSILTGIFEQNPKFPDNFGCWYLYILDQANSRPKQTIEEKTKLKFNHVDIKFMLKSHIKNSEIGFRDRGSFSDPPTLFRQSLKF